MIEFDDYIFDSLMRDLVGHDRRPASFLVYAWLAAEQKGLERQATNENAYLNDLAAELGTHVGVPAIGPLRKLVGRD